MRKRARGWVEYDVNELPAVEKYLDILIGMHNAAMEARGSKDITVDIQDALDYSARMAMREFQQAISNTLHLPRGSEIEITEAKNRTVIRVRSSGG